jgi:hypothetical protein
MKTKYILFYFLSLAPFFCFAQTVPSKIPTVLETPVLESDVESLKKELEGTFSIQISQADYHILYTKELFETIKNSRKATETVQLNWDSYTTIIIFPLSHNPASIYNSPKSE